MRNLFWAGMQRLKKDKWLWLGIFITAVYSIYTCSSSYSANVKYQMDITLEDMIFRFLVFTGITLSVSISVFIGTEYSDGTIRNKIATGHLRRNIYLSNFFLCVMEAVISYILLVVLNCIIGIPLFGFFRYSVGRTGYMMLLGLLISIVFASLYNMVAMISQSKAHTAIICILVGFILLFAGMYLYQLLSAPEVYEYADFGADGQAIVMTEKNPFYLEGTRREVYQFVFDFLPGGQVLQVIMGGIVHPVRLVVCSVFNLIVYNLLGLFIFQRKDIK